MSHQQHSKMNSIQLLRAIAVILVVHAHVIDQQPGIYFQKKFFYLENFGAAGVDIFFVISGFIITIISSRYAANKEGLYFLIKRIVRIMPLYWLVLLLYAVLLYLHNGKLYSTASIVRSITFVPFVKSAGKTVLVVSQAWTLYFEMLFYLVVSMAITIYNKKYIFITIVFFTGLVLLNYLSGTRYPALVVAGNGIMIEFILGVIAGLLFCSSFSIQAIAANSIFIAGVAGFVATIFLGYNNISESAGTANGTLSVWRSLIWGIPSFLVVMGLVIKEKTGPVRVPFFWVAIGNASFSIYLTHSLFLILLYGRWNSWGLQQYLLPDVQVLISVALTIAFGYAFFIWVELPLLRSLTPFANKWKRYRLAKTRPQQI